MPLRVHSLSDSMLHLMLIFPFHDHLSPRQTRRGAAHAGRRGRERRRLRSSHPAVVVRQIAAARPAGETAHATRHPRGRARALRFHDGGGTRFVPAARQQRLRHRPENRAEHFERHERDGISRRGGRRRREIALANFRRRQENRRAHRGRVARQNRRGGRVGSRQRETFCFRPTTRS